MKVVGQHIGEQVTKAYGCENEFPAETLKPTRI